MGLALMEGYFKGKPSVAWWTTQISKGIKFREKFAREKQWELWRNYYRGNWTGDVLPSALYFKLLRTVVPRIYFRNPSISITSGKPGPLNMAFATILERVDNKLLRAMKVKKQVKRITQNGFMFGTGIGKLGYGAEYTLVPDAGGTDDPKKQGESFEYNSLVKPNMPWFMSVHPGNFIVPAGITDYDDARWTAMWVQRPLEDVRNDPRFKKLGEVATSTGTSPIGNVDGTRSKIQRPVAMVDLVEVRDKKTGQAFVLAPYASDKIAYGPVTDDLFVNGRHTFYPVTFNDDDEVFWGVPDSVNIDPMQRELNEIKTQQMKHRRLLLIKLLAKRNSITPDEIAKMVSETVDPVVWTEDDIEKAVKIVDAGHIPSDLFTAEEAVMRESREMVGFSRNQFGEFKPGSSDTTATEARIVAQAAEIRVDERRDMLADMLVDMVTDMHTVIFNEWDQEQLIDIVGPQGAQIWVKFTGEMLKGGAYEVNIDPDSSIPETKAVREQKAMQMYQMFSQDPMFDPMKLRKFVIGEMNNVALEDVLMNAGLPPESGRSEDTAVNPQQLGQILQSAAGPRKAA